MTKYILRGNTLYQKPDREEPKVNDYVTSDLVHARGIQLLRFQLALGEYNTYLSTLPHYPASDELIAFMGDRKEIGEDEFELRNDFSEYDVDIVWTSGSNKIAYPKRQEEDVWEIALKEADKWANEKENGLFLDNKQYINRIKEYLKQSYRITKI